MVPENVIMKLTPTALRRTPITLTNVEKLIFFIDFNLANKKKERNWTSEPCFISTYGL